MVQTPQGKNVYLEPWKQQGIIGTIIGLESGTVWTLEFMTSPYVEISTADRVISLTFTTIARAVS